MSLILKGIDMPKDNKSICVTIWNDGIIYATDENKNQIDTKESEAIQIPTPHGRLGDLDVLLEESLKEGAYNYVDSWQIAEQPTILESEE